MFEKLGRIAEGMAAGVGTSRRGFLDRLGRSALAAAGALGVAAAGTMARAGGGVVCCKYRGGIGGHYYYKHPYFIYVCQPAGTTCAPLFDNLPLRQQRNVSDCTNCG
jgi:hypothetical protein